MEIISKPEVRHEGIKFLMMDNGQEVGRAFLYILYNDLHVEPFGFLEDLFVADSFRGKGVGTELVQSVINEAQKQGCHKLICTSRHGREELHGWYKKLGFVDHGTEFRMDF